MKTRKKNGRTMYRVADGYVAKGATVWVFLPSSGMPVPKTFRGPTFIKKFNANYYRPYAKRTREWNPDGERSKPERWEEVGCLVSRPQIHSADRVNYTSLKAGMVFTSFETCCSDNGIDADSSRLGANHNVKVGIVIGRRRVAA